MYLLIQVKSIEDEQPQESAYCCVRSDEDWKWVVWKKAVFRDEEGDIVDAKEWFIIPKPIFQSRPVRGQRCHVYDIRRKEWGYAYWVEEDERFVQWNKYGDRIVSVGAWYPELPKPQIPQIKIPPPKKND